MSNTIDCPTCGGKSKIIETNGENCFKVIDKVELLKKVIKLKKAMTKFQNEATLLEEELNQLKIKK